MDETLTLIEIAAKYHLDEKYVKRVLASQESGAWHATLSWLASLGEGMIEFTPYTSANLLGSKIKLPEKFPAQLFP
jgi:hypothetical protein